MEEYFEERVTEEIIEEVAVEGVIGDVAAEGIIEDVVVEDVVARCRDSVSRSWESAESSSRAH